MDLRILVLSTAAAMLAAPLAATAANALTSLHPEAAYPNDAPPMLSPGPYAEFNKRVQQKLQELGFDAGRVNGDFGSKTQAALAQFQLSRNLPASGQLDDPTVAELGVEREAQNAEASAGASAMSTRP